LNPGGHGAAARRTLFAALFFLSGAAGLVYEQIWIRLLYHHFGSSIHSITTVVAAYMGGLGLGAFALGRRADRHPRPARLYGLLELAIGAFGLLSPLILRGVGDSYLALARLLQPGLWPATALKFVFAFVVMLIPTFLMGGTLPVLTRAFAAGRPDRYRRELALFYGLNTVGGVAGCALAGYVLIEYVGLNSTLLATGVLNLLLGAAALLVTRRDAEANAEREDPGTAEHVAVPPGPLAGGDPRARRFALWLIGITAFASLLYEIAWTRVLVLVVGSSTYAFTTILVCFLLGIGLGSLFAVGRGRPTRELLVRAALIEGAIGLLAALLFPFFRVLPVYIVAILQVPFLSVTAILLLQALALAAVVVPPAVGMGLAFPLFAEVAQTGDAAGGDTGRSYFANTLGSIAGAVLTGFVLIHTIGSERALLIGVLCNVGAVVALVVWLARGRVARVGASGVSGAAAALGLAALALVVALGTPSWSSRLLDRGPAIYGHDSMDARELQNFLRGWGSEQLLFDEGWNAAISVWRNGGMTWLKTNGKTDASSVPDMNTQVGLALLPAATHPHPTRAFVIGFGSGVSVHTISLVPGIAHVDVAEIERAVLRAAPLFAGVNGGVATDPRVHIIEDDARSALQLSRSRYDIIMSEPSNPWIAGVASLFTSDYFRIAASRLAEGGIYAQWVQTYRVPPSVVAVVVANLRAVFPHVEMYYANSSDLILLASRRPIVWDKNRIAALLAPGSPVRASFHDWLEIDRPSQVLGMFLLSDKGTAMLASSAPFRHSDDRPALEFVAARGLLATGDDSPVFDSLLAVRAAAGDTVPALRDWTLAPGEWQAAYGHDLPSDEDLARTMAAAALAADSTNPDYQAVMGRLLYQRRDYGAAVPLLAAALRRAPDDPDLLVMTGAARDALGDSAAAEQLLERAGAAGGDSALALSLLARDAVARGDWPRAAAEAMRAIDGVHPTLRAPFPGALQEVVRRLAQAGPVEVAAPVLDSARARRPSWDLGYWGGAEVYRRWGGTHCARAADLAGQLGRFGWTRREVDGLLANCRKS